MWEVEEDAQLIATVRQRERTRLKSHNSFPSNFRSPIRPHLLRVLPHSNIIKLNAISLRHGP
jgi:hypothetical protein